MECKICNTPFTETRGEIALRKRMAFSFAEASVELPSPQLCPECRELIRSGHRNEQNLYHRTSLLSGQKLISMYTPTPVGMTALPVLSQEEWHGDTWDPFEYGREFDFTRPFFEQMAELQRAVPRIALVTLGNENSPFVTNTAYCRNCHLITCSENSEDCIYGKLLQRCRDCVDCSYAYDSELCYECVEVERCYDCIALFASRDSSESLFSVNLLGCKHCLFCSDLHQADFMIANERVTPDTFYAEVKKIKSSYREFAGAFARWREMLRSRQEPVVIIRNCENCTGASLYNSRDCVECTDVSDSERAYHVTVGVKITDVADSMNIYLGAELCYQVVRSIGCYHIAYSLYVFHCRDVLYSDHCFHSNNLFGCMRLKRAENCILNTQYSSREYKALAHRIALHMQETGEWGQFFPLSTSAFGLNESLAAERYPIEPEIARGLGARWHIFEAVADSSSPKALSDKANLTAETILTETLSCDATGRSYRLTAPELRFYQRQQLPIPRLSPFARHKQREDLKRGKP